MHCIDYSDHFSHSDSSITPINFLQFSDSEWDTYADNLYMYMNRLRHDEYLDMFKSSGLKILSDTQTLHKQSLELIKKGGIKIDQRFKNKPDEILAVIDAWIVACN